MKNKIVIQSKITLGSYREFIDSILSLAKNKLSSYICVCNVHMLIEAYDSSEFSEVLNNADIVTPDGMPVAKAIKWLYGVEQPRVAGMDLIASLFSEFEKQKMSVLLYGSTDDVLDRIEKKTTRYHPSLSILDKISPPFRKLSEIEELDIINKINVLNPDFIFVSLGCPKQEIWMYENRNKINSCMIGLGGAFSVYIGETPRCPIWMQKYALEWLYRLYNEPGRLWKRYLYTNSKFILLFFIQYLKQKIFRIA